MWCLLDTSTRICKYKAYSETVCLICNSYNLKLQQKKLDKRLYRQAAIVGSEFQNQNAKTQINLYDSEEYKPESFRRNYCCYAFVQLVVNI